MKSAAEAIRSARSSAASDLLDQVDYRLAETPEEKDEIYRLRYRAYLHEGAIDAARNRSASPIASMMLPNAWIFGVYLRRRTLQFHPHQRADVGMADVAVGRAVRRSASSANSTGARFSSIRPASSPIPSKAKRFPELPYVTVRLGYVACGYFNADIGLATGSSRASGVLSPGVSAGAAGASRGCFRALIKPVGLMAADYPAMREQVFAAVSLSCVPARSSGGCCSSAAASDLSAPDAAGLHVRARLDRSAVLTGEPVAPGSGRGVAISANRLPHLLRASKSPGRHEKPVRPRLAACLHPRATFTTH